MAFVLSEQTRDPSGLTAAAATAPLRPNLVDALESSYPLWLERTCDSRICTHDPAPCESRQKNIKCSRSRFSDVRIDAREEDSNVATHDPTTGVSPI